MAGSPASGASAAWVSGAAAARGAVSLAIQGTAFNHEQILDLFVRHFKRPGPPQGTIVIHPDQASFEAAVQAAGLPSGTYGFFAHPREDFAGEMGLIHLPPTASTLVTIHESLHMIGRQSGVIQILGQYVEEGLTEWLARSLGPQTIQGLYDSNVAFVKLLAGVVGADTLRSAYLHRRWAPLRTALRARLGSEQAVEHFYRLLRQVGPYGQRGGVLREAIDMLWPASSGASTPRSTGRSAAIRPAAVTPPRSRGNAGATSSAAAPKQSDTPASGWDPQEIERAVARETASFLRPGSQPLDPDRLRPSGEQVLSAPSRERARQQWEQALLPLAQQPKGGRIGQIQVEGVNFHSVEVTRRGTELLVGYFGFERRSAPGGAAAEIHEALEKAAFQVARQIRARSVRVFARKAVSKWRDTLLARGYRAHVFEHADGLEAVLAKRFPVPGDMLTVGEDRLRQALPPVPAQWSGVQTFGADGIKWGTGVVGATSRLQALRKMGRRKAIRELAEAGITLNIAEKWRFHYYFEYYVAGTANATAKAREELMTYVVEILSSMRRP
jgi:hypothetical protein